VRYKYLARPDLVLLQHTRLILFTVQNQEDSLGCSELLCLGLSKGRDFHFMFSRPWIPQKFKKDMSAASCLIQNHFSSNKSSRALESLKNQIPTHRNSFYRMCAFGVPLMRYKYHLLLPLSFFSIIPICTSVLPKRKRQRRMFGAPVSAL
jgi:hypothetical protein